MSDMSSSWGFSSTRSKLKTYVSRAEPHTRRLLDRGQSDEGKGFRAWIKEKSKGSFGSSTDSLTAGVEVVNIFPGWAARRYAQKSETQVPPQFEVEVFVSGFACSRRDPENATRSQRAFLRLAKSFAGLPKIVESTANVAPYETTIAHLTPQTEERLTFAPQNNAEPDPGLDMEALDRELNLVKLDDSEDNRSESSSSCDDHPSPSGKKVPTPHLPLLKHLHDNLEKRIRCLWYTALPNRTIRLHFLVSPHKDAAEKPEASSDEAKFSLEPEDGLLATEDVITGPDGAFQAKVRVKWEDLCHNPRAIHFAFGETIEDHDLLVVAKLLPQSDQPTSIPPPTTLATPLATITRIPITHSPIRVISDIDDTVKHSGILSGARTVFHNVFVKDMRDNVIPGMGEWYMKMFSQGVRFHYVSNGPFAILPILNDFFHISQLPSGSLKLRSYAGRSLFDGFLSAPATRKRSGVLEVLDSFPDSLFFLIGDTGEQDLELYADIARERPDQILGVFLRDARPYSQSVPEPLSDPTGSRALDLLNDIERPAIQRTDSTPAGSLGLLLKRFPSYRTQNPVWRTASLPSLGVASAVATPNNTSSSQSSPSPSSKSTRFTLDSVSKTSESYSYSRLKDKYRPYFGLGPLTSQPEENGFNSPGSAPTSPRPLSQSSEQTVDQVFITEAPKAIPSPSITNARIPSFCAKRPGSSSSSSSTYESSDCQNKGSLRDQLQKRVYRARKLIPEQIVLRIFGDPEECVEVDDILRLDGSAAHNE